jgi:hypothetical protein
VKDLLFKLGQPAASAVAVIPPEPANVDRMCTTACKRLVECQPGAGAAQCEENCRLRAGDKLRPYDRADYVDAFVKCVEAATKQFFDCYGRSDGEERCMKGMGAGPGRRRDRAPPPMRERAVRDARAVSRLVGGVADALGDRRPHRKGPAL